MQQELGRSLIEMLGVLAIGAVMTVGAYKTYGALRANQVRNLAISEMEQVARNTKILLEMRGDYTGVSVEYLIKAGAITNAKTPMGADWYIDAAADGKSFAINLVNVSTGDCAYLATKKLDWVKSVTINKITTAGAESCISGDRNLVSIIVE